MKGVFDLMQLKTVLFVIPALLVAGCSSNQPAETTTPSTGEPTVDFGQSEANRVEFTIDSESGLDLSVYTPDTSEYYFMEDDHDMLKGLTFEEALKIYADDSNFTGVVFYGYPRCAFCNEALPTLVDVAVENNQPFYYINVKMAGYEISDEDLAEFENYAYAYYQDDEQGGKSFFVPTVFAIKDGKILDAHTGLLDDVTIDTSEPLTQDVYDELSGIYQNLYDLVYGG